MFTVSALGLLQLRNLVHDILSVLKLHSPQCESSKSSFLKKIIIKSVFTGHQKIMLIGFSIAFFLAGLSTVGWYVLYALGKIESDNPFSSNDLITGFLFLLSFPLIGIALAKEGLILESSKIYQSKFLFKRPVAKTELDITGFTDIGLLGQNLSQKYAFGASPNPDEAYSYKEYRVYLLNNNHSKKLLLASCKEAEQANQLISQITDQVNLERKNYDPPRSGKRRR